MASRKGAGDASRVVASGRTMKNNDSDACAARCRRRNDSGRTWFCQKSSAPHVPALRTCSAAHSASAVLGAFSNIMLSQVRPHQAKAVGCTACGACRKMIGLPTSFSNAGRSKRNSPHPFCCTSRSVKAPSGQPPPGSSAASSALPQSMARAAPRPSWFPFHRSGWIASGSTAFMAAPKHCIKTQYNLAHDSGADDSISWRHDILHRCNPPGGGPARAQRAPVGLR